jgi:hypothetical protein
LGSLDCPISTRKVVGKPASHDAGQGRPVQNFATIIGVRDQSWCFYEDLSLEILRFRSIDSYGKINSKGERAC